MDSLEMLSQIANGLGPLKDKVVFVGGSTVSLYLTDPGAQTVRPTEDVDCVAEIVSRPEYYGLQEELLRLGFKHATEENSPICRWKFHGIFADIMPTEGAVLNFKNSWYADGYAAAETVELRNGQTVKIFTLPYFLASKIEAFLDRGGEDYLTSPDMEDIITVLDGADNVTEKISTAPEKVKSYLVAKFLDFMEDERFVESLYGNLRSPTGTDGRVERIKSMLTSLCGDMGR